MPQEIRVLCCFKCKMYQVDIVKKAKKWQCKLCGEKQSVLKEIFRGTGAECRQKAQELNITINTKRNEVENELLDLLERDDLEIDFESIVNEERKQCGQLKATESKWTKFVETPKESSLPLVSVEPAYNLKRKSNSKPDELQNSKSSKSFVSANSKWNAYL